ncbi:MAG: hypothetical protein ACXU9P_04500 [Thermodesulfobacteriota bacterium]
MENVKILIFLFCIFLVGCASNRYSKPRVELDDFRGIKWGAEITTLEGMEKVEQDKSPNRDIAWYARKGETLTFGKAKLENIFYSFWMGSFESVWMDFKGEENFQALKQELFERFGKVLESGELMEKTDKKTMMEPSTPQPRYGGEEFYFWDGKQMEMWLSYSKDRQKGSLSINSKKMSEERRDYEKRKEKEERFREKRF